MANQQNLKPFNKMNSEEALKIQKKGGVASVEARRKKKAFREQMQMLLEKNVTNPFYIEDMQEAGIEESEMNNQMLLVFNLFNEGRKGNIKAISTIVNLMQNNSSEEA